MPNGGHKSAQAYLLDRRSSIIVVAQLSPEFTAAIVDRWDELERRAQAGTLGTPSDTLFANVPARMGALENALLTLARKIDELASRPAPAPLALPAPEKGPKLITAARYLKKAHGWKGRRVNSPPR